VSDRQPLAHLLAQLNNAEPNPQRSTRVRNRCRAVLARQTTPAAQTSPRRLESLCIVGLCVAYLITVIQHALQ